MVTTGLDATGLDQLVRDLRKIDRGLPKAMREQMLPISLMVRQTATTRANQLGGVHAHAVRRGLRSGATQRTAWIKLVASREPTILGAEFGGGGRPTTHQFPPWRGSGRNAGYFVYPTLRAEGDVIMRHMEDAVIQVLHQAGFR